MSLRSHPPHRPKKWDVSGPLGKSLDYDFDVVMANKDDSYSSAKHWSALGRKAVELGARLPGDEIVDLPIDDSEMKRWIPNWMTGHASTFLNFGLVVALAQRQKDAIRSRALQQKLDRSRGETAETEHRLEDAIVRANNAEERVRELKDTLRELGCSSGEC